MADKGAREILDSGLFNEAYYVSSCPADVSSCPSPLEHYLTRGALSGYDPHPLFDTSYYVDCYAGAIAGINPLIHYLTVGWAMDYQPNPLFDPRYYRSRRGHGIPDAISPLEDYARDFQTGRSAMHPLFDATYYLEQLPEAENHEFKPLGHYFLSWAQHRVSPHPLFDVPYYLSQCSDVLHSGLDPVSHYLLVGHQRCLNPHPLFSTAFYYDRYPDVRATGANALVHYLTSGGFEGRDPGPWFSSAYYCGNNPEVAATGVNPLVHYIGRGSREGRDPLPMFRGSHWARVHNLDSVGPEALIHFAHVMSQEGFHPLESLRLRERPRSMTENPSRSHGQPGLNLIGWPRLEIGVGEYLREVARAADSVSLNFSIRDVSLMRSEDPGDESWSHRISQESIYNTSLFVVNADNMQTTCNYLGFESVRDRFNIGMWAWELADCPDVWRREMSVLDEIWAFSLFTQECLALKSPVPVVYMPMPVTLSTDAGLARADFGIPDDRFVFLFQFDFTGFIQRKNPWAALAAFRKAFPRRNSGAALVIKTNNSERYPELMSELIDAVGTDPDVVFVNGTFRRDKVISLMHLSDAFVSLHRSEGFGRSLAEAMLLGKPAVATNYSGNTDFMNQQNSCLVNYTLAPVKEGQYPFSEGQVWADPDIEHAAWHMRRLNSKPCLSGVVVEYRARDYQRALQPRRRWETIFEASGAARPDTYEAIARIHCRPAIV